MDLSRRFKDSLNPLLPTHSTARIGMPKSRSLWSVGSSTTARASLASINESIIPMDTKSIARANLTRYPNPSITSLQTVRSSLSRASQVPQVFVYNSLHKLDSFFNRRTKGKSSAEAIKTLIADGKLDPNEPANTNSSILALAVQSGDSESVRVLLEHGASDDGSEAGMYGSILTISAIWGNMEAFNLLVDHGATVQESAAFHEAVYHTRYDMVKILLDRGSNPNAKMPRSYTEGLVKHGKSYGGLWRPDHGQPRPLHIAVWRAANMAKKEKKSPPRKDSLSMISLLIARGANLNLGDDQGRTPLDILKEGDDRDVVEILWTALMPGTSRGRLS